MHGFKKTVAVILILSLTLIVGGCETYQYQGAGVGGAMGGLMGALLDHRNPWRGGVIGAAIGAAIGATLAEISEQGAQEAARTGKPVEYTTRADDGSTAVYRATPVDYDARTKCHKVQERVWQDGELVKDQVREVCESSKTESGYLSSEPQGPSGRDYDERYNDRYESPSPQRDYDYRDEQSVGGPPPWAPAHGYRAKHRYRYYPDSYVYYGEDSNLYYYRYAGRWVESPLLPSNIYLDTRGYVILEMDNDRPYMYHSDVIRRYPPGYR